VVAVQGDTGCSGRRCACARDGITGCGDVSAMVRVTRRMAQRTRLVGSGGGEMGGRRRGAGRQGVGDVGVIVAVQAPVEGGRQRL
jgi:hypothetical protein